ncbi:MAG: response regulator, partial [Calditrichaceae bacterium]
KAFPTEADAFSRQNKLTSACVMGDGHIAIGSRDNGLAIIDRSGKWLYHLNKNNGLLGNTIWNVFADDQNGLWLALNNGLTCIDAMSPLIRIPETTGLEGTIESIVRHQGILYIATPAGLYFIDKKEFSDIHKIESFIPYKLFSTGDVLLASGYNNGMYEVKNKTVSRISKFGGNNMLQSLMDSNRIFIATDNGLASIYYKNGGWIDEGEILLENAPSRDMVQTKDGVLWLSTMGSTIIRVEFKKKIFSIKDVRIQYFDETNGFYPSDQNHLFLFNNQLIIGNANHLLQYDSRSGQFSQHELYNELFNDTTYSVIELAMDSLQNLFMFTSSKSGLGICEAAFEEQNRYELNIKPFLPLKNLSFYCVYPDPQNRNAIWFGGPDGLYRFDINVSKQYDINFPCLIRRVSTLSDSIIFNGNSNMVGPDSASVLDYKDNALRFNFSVPYYFYEDANQYQYYLEGFDKGWSKWNSEPKAIYTNIPEGRYLLRVRAKNIYDSISKESFYAFKIAPPWYRSLWAYGLYGIIIIGLMFGLIKLRSLKLEVEKKHLEEIIEDRTNDIRVKNLQLNEQAEKLKELDELKSRFFANISHEFRTPLTLIKGPVEEILEQNKDEHVKKSSELILQNANRLLLLINQLLDLSKLESGGMVLKAALQPVTPFVRVIINAFSALAKSRKIHLSFLGLEEDIELYFDREKLEKVLFNLLSYAFKFTPEYGFIIVTIEILNQDFDFYPDGAVKISVQDSGNGIPAEDIDLIFERFSQAKNTESQLNQGSGIGLALTKELVELHHGQIEVDSTVDEGTRFDIILPLGSNHLKSEEIIEDTKADSDIKMDMDVSLAEFSHTVPDKMRTEDDAINTDKKMVLIVEDHPDVRQYLRDHLDNDYRIVEAENGAIGVESAKEHFPDLIISDVMMPEMDGYQLTDILKNDLLTSHIPIILLTAKDTDDDRIEGLKTGADAYMAKPFNAKELAVRVHNLIESRAKLKKTIRQELLLEPKKIEKVSLDDEFLQKINDVIQKNMSDPHFGVEMLLRDFPLSQRQFTRKLQALTGHSPVQLIRLMRLKRAKQLFDQNAGTVSQIAFEAGFNNLSYFTKCFRDQFGHLPSEFK